MSEKRRFYEHAEVAEWLELQAESHEDVFGLASARILLVTRESWLQEAPTPKLNRVSDGYDGSVTLKYEPDLSHLKFGDKIKVTYDNIIGYGVVIKVDKSDNSMKIMKQDVDGDYENTWMWADRISSIEVISEFPKAVVLEELNQDNGVDDSLELEDHPF